MRQYEMTYLISDKIGEHDLTATTGKVNGLITAHGGKVLGEENWGRRKLAYSINKLDFATYVTLNFELMPEELTKLNRELTLNKEVVRSMIIVKDHGKEELKLTADEIAETEDIEEVIGGERSFEAVEGETEESYDLMAKREEEENVSPPQRGPLIPRLKDTVGDTAKSGKIVAEEIKEETTAQEDTEKPKEDVTVQKSAEKTQTEEVTKPKKPAGKKEKPVEAKAETKIAKPEKKTAKKTDKTDSADSKKQKAEDEADRLAKLDEEIEGILGDDL